MEGYRGNSRGFSHLWEDTVMSVTMALVRLVDCRRAGVKSFLPVCHKAEWPSSIRCDPLVCFLVFLSFQCLKLSRNSKRENDTISWNDLDCRLTNNESDLSSSARTYFDWKIEKNSAYQVLSGSWPCTLRSQQLQHENLLQTARKGVGDAGSDFRSLSIACGLPRLKPVRIVWSRRNLVVDISIIKN